MITVYVSLMGDGEVVPASDASAPVTSGSGGIAGAAEDNQFAFLELTGERFDAPGMPLDALRELSNLKDAVMAAARERWLEAHEGRSNVPAGFADSLDLRLLKVDPGSVRPVFYLNTSAVGDEDEDEAFPLYYRGGLVQVATALQQINQRGVVSSDEVSLKVQRSIRKIGSTLLPGETLVFGDPVDADQRAKVDQDTVEILRRIDAIGMGSESVDLIGFITEYDSVGRSFRLATATGAALCRLDLAHPELTLRVKEFLAPDGITAPDVIVRGQSDDPRKPSPTLDSVFDVSVYRTVEQKVLATEVRWIASLNDGWLGPESTVPTRNQSRQALEVADLLQRHEVEAHAIPSEGGAIVFEWRWGLVEMTASIEPGGNLFLCYDNSESDELRESEGEYDQEKILAFVLRGDVDG